MLKLFQKILGLRKTEKETKKVDAGVEEIQQEVTKAKESWMQDVIEFEQDIRKIHTLIKRSTAYRIAKRTGNLVK